MYHYIIYNDQDEQAYDEFCRQTQGRIFIPINRVDINGISDFILPLLFDLEKAKEILKRSIRPAEIENSLSHIKCWQQIANNSAIANDAFILIAETDMRFVEGGLDALEQHINGFLQNSHYDLVLLQRADQDLFWSEKIYQAGNELTSIIFSNPASYNNTGSGLYLIRKKAILAILQKLQSSKPYWKADRFSEIYPFEKIAQLAEFIARKHFVMPYQKPNKPLFSIIVPIYNVEAYLEQAIESVLQQDFYQYEIILVDDGSTDCSGDIAYRYAQQYPHIRFLSQPNGGVSIARNNAMKISQGEYFIFLDPDDFWRGTHILSDLSQIIQEKNPDLIISHLSSFYPDRVVSHLIDTSDLSGNYEQDIVQLVKRGGYQGFPSMKIVHRDIIMANQLFFAEGRHYEDVLWSIQLVKAVKTYANYNSDHYMYRRQREGAITQYVTLKNVQDLFYIYQQAYLELEELDKAGLIYQALASFLIGTYSYADKIYYLLSEADQQHLVNEYNAFRQLEINEC